MPFQEEEKMIDGAGYERKMLRNRKLLRTTQLSGDITQATSNLRSVDQCLDLNTSINIIWTIMHYCKKK